MYDGIMSLLAGTLSQQSAMRPATAAIVAFLAGLAAGIWLHGAVPEMPEAPAIARQGDRLPSASIGRQPTDVMRVIDGDTFDARVQVWPGIEITTKVRLRNVDAPEMRGRCSAERRKAEAARDALAHMLGEGQVTLSRIGLDKYGGRVDADVSTRATPDVGDALVKAGLARPYDGGRRDGWC